MSAFYGRASLNANYGLKRKQESRYFLLRNACTIEILVLEQVCGTGPANIFGERTPSTLDNVIYFKGTIFKQSTKPLFTPRNRVEVS
jgi:hypothetical protein